MSRLFTVFLAAYFLIPAPANAQLAEGDKRKFTHADTLRGSITPERAWWNVLRYEIAIRPDFTQRSVQGKTLIYFQALQTGERLQLDLQQPLRITALHWRNTTLKFKREGNAFHVRFPRPIPKGSLETITADYEGTPIVAARPPWDGGWIWTQDRDGRPWMSVACQGKGASVWYPCKDHQSDEPDSGASLAITAPDSLVAIGNGRLTGKKPNGDGTTTWTWNVVNPINNYDIVPYIGKYVSFEEAFAGEKGRLDCAFWVLDYNLEKAKEHFKIVDTMLRCFEYWMGPYPFYEDSYKLVEAPHLGMEHQSAVAYGNHYQNGYLGRDRSGSGWGLKWDFIIVHESGHEWFGNNITSKDLADMWIHEGFTTYTETLYTTCQYGEQAGDDYIIGQRKNISNDKPIIGAYNVNDEGSSDMYDKGGNLIHMIRQITGDSAFRQLLRGLSDTFYHKTVTTRDIETYISRHTGKDLSKVFDQYLRTTSIPELEYKFNGSTLLSYRWTHCVKGFNLPIRIILPGEAPQWIQPAEDWKTLNTKNTDTDKALQVDRNFYVTARKL